MMLALDDAQLKQFDEEGWLFFEDVFDADEVALLNREARRIFAMDRQEVFREKDGTTARTASASLINSTSRLWCRASRAPARPNRRSMYFATWRARRSRGRASASASRPSVTANRVEPGLWYIDSSSGLAPSGRQTRRLAMRMVATSGVVVLQIM